MISVLIPLYQVNFNALIDSLIMQLSSISLQYEILIGDDSPDSVNHTFPENWKSQPIKYFHNKNSMGRSANRNKLADNAIFENLLFIDCDALVPDSEFILKYINEIDGKSVLCGGTSYQMNKPERKEQILRWTYGWKREVHSSVARSKNPYNSFSSFNFCIPSSIFKEIRFDERINDYGHEDTYFGFELKERGVPIKHLENPLIHNGLESSDVFLKKTQKSIEGLLSLARRDAIPAGFLDSNSLWQASERAKRSGFIIILRLIYPLLMSLVSVLLKSRNPSLFLFDLYKLSYLSKIQG